jgi:predicted membrane protein (TIGR00267 family)
MKYERTRHIVRGLIDGSLSTLGVIIGASGANPAIIITAGLGGGIANGLSNILGAFTAEKARVEQELSKLERAMLKDGLLRGTLIHEKAKKITVIGGLSDGLSTILGSLIPIFPFILMFFVGYTREIAMSLSISVTIFLLFFLGIYLGALSKENIALAGLKMAVIGLITALICTLVEKSFRTLLG